MKEKKVKALKEKKEATLSSSPLEDVVEYAKKLEEAAIFFVEDKEDEDDGFGTVSQGVSSSSTYIHPASIVEHVKSLLAEAPIESVKIPANEVIIEQEEEKIVVKAEIPKQKAVRLLSEMSESELAQYAKKYSLAPSIEVVAEFLVEKKPASLAQNKIW